MSNTVIKTYASPPIDRAEIFRYLRSEPTESLSDTVESALAEVEDKLTYKVCYRYFDISETDGELDLGFATCSSHSLIKYLGGCDGIILFAATVGSLLDRMIKRCSLISPAKALVLDAIGNERVEALCDEFCKDIENEMINKGRNVKKRFSPGYGDLPLELQRCVFRALSPESVIGVSLSEALLMSPTKSVTAIIGIEETRK